METYRRGRNETDSKSVCPKGHEGSNPSVSAICEISKGQTKRALLRNEFLKQGSLLFVRATRPSKRKLTRGLSSKVKTWSGLAMWLVLFVLLRIDWGKGIRQVRVSMVGYVQVVISGTVGSGE